MNQSSDRRILLFDLSVGGHYPEYISHLVSHWCEQKLPGWLNVVVIPEFLERHSDVVAISSKSDQVNFVPLTVEEKKALRPYRSGLDRNIRAWQEFSLLNKYAKKLKINRIFLPYFDTRMLPLALGRSLPCPFSGIYFRPSFHYPQLSNLSLSWKDRVQHLREKITLSRVLKNHNLKTLYSLDPFAVEHINHLGMAFKAQSLPDPVKIHQNTSDSLIIRSNLKIDSDRQVHLLFGNLNQRKGVDQVLDAIALLPQELGAKLCLLMVGSMSEKDRDRYHCRQMELCQSFPVQIIIHNEYICEEDIQKYFKAADVILAPYQRHVGMSGILNRAAVAQKPVLSSDYGLMGEITRRYELGLAVDSTSASTIAEAMAKFLADSPHKQCNPEQMATFAGQNSVAKFTNTIFQNL